MSDLLLMGPGPSPVSERVRAAMSRPLYGHLDPRFLRELDGISEDLRLCFGSTAPLTFPVSGTGSAAMETAVLNLVWPGRRVLVLENGVFAERISEMARRAGGELRRLSFPYGTPVDPEQARQAMEEFRPDVVAVVHAETSTGVLNPVGAVAQAARDVSARLIVDTVTSLGGMPVTMDEWGAAVVYSGSQKCLGCPPGLGPISVAGAALAERPKDLPVVSWYLDLGLIAKYLGTERLYHHTAPISMVFALREALTAVREEGLERRFARHRQASSALRAGLAAYGLGSLVRPGSELPSLSVVSAPEDQDEGRLRQELLEVEDVEIAGGLGPWKGKAWRIGTMGEGANLDPVVRTLESIGRVLGRHGVAADVREARRAAEEQWRAVSPALRA